jgi:hypothetical protein
MSLDQFLVLVAIVFAGATLYVAYRTLQATNRDVEISRRTEQLTQRSVELSEEAARRPVLEVERMHLAVPQIFSFLGEIRDQQEGYEGPEPDYILRVSLRNRGRVPALRVGGALTIFGGFAEPVSYPGYTNILIQYVHTAPAYELTIPYSDANRAPAEPTHSGLDFLIPLKLFSSPESNDEWEEMLNREMHVRYWLAPENGDAIEGEWIVENSSAPGPTRPANAGPVQDSERLLRAPADDHRSEETLSEPVPDSETSLEVEQGGERRSWWHRVFGG